MIMERLSFFGGAFLYWLQKQVLCSSFATIIYIQTNQQILHDK